MVRFMVKSIVKIFRENRIKRRMFPNVGMGFWWSNLWSNDLERAVLSGDLPYFRGLYISVKLEARHTREFAAMPLLRFFREFMILGRIYKNKIEEGGSEMVYVKKAQIYLPRFLLVFPPGAGISWRDISTKRRRER